MRVRILAAVFAAALVISLTGCGETAADTTAPQTDTAPESGEKCIELALSCKALLEKSGAGAMDGNVNLSAEQCTELMEKLAQNGECAFEYSRTQDITNPDAVRAFFEDNAAEKSLRLVEVCQDGGLLTHELSFSPEGNTLTLTRTARSGGSPEMTYSHSYPLTRAELNGGTVEYEYYWRENPDGTKHDGHVETSEKIVLEHK